MVWPEAGGVGADGDCGPVGLVGGDAVVDPAVNGSAADADLLGEGLDGRGLGLDGEGRKGSRGLAGRLMPLASSLFLVPVARLSR